MESNGLPLVVRRTKLNQMSPWHPQEYLWELIMSDIVVATLEVSYEEFMILWMKSNPWKIIVEMD